SPLGIDAALQLIADREQASGERLRQSEMALQQARYEVTHARRQYDAVDPDNRLVASELERRWNERLAAAARLEEQIRSLQNEQPRVLCEDERAALLALADDLPRLWNHPAASSDRSTQPRHLMDMNNTPEPRMPQVENLEFLDLMGVISSPC